MLLRVRDKGRATDSLHLSPFLLSEFHCLVARNRVVQFQKRVLKVRVRVRVRARVYNFRSGS